MARAIPVPVRLVLFRRAQHGQTTAEIAHALALRPRTVRHLLQRFDAGEGATLEPAYDRCGKERPWPNADVVAEAIHLRRQHAGWGAGLIRVLLHERWPKEPLPSTRTLQRWLAREGLGPAPRGIKPTSSQARARRPHEIWQMDAVEQIRLQREPHASWLRLTDEFTGAMLHTKVFAFGCFAHAGGSSVQVELRKAFTQWGRPESVRVDNGVPWGSTGDLPTLLALWLVGLQVRMIWNPPRRPTKNAVVERSQGVSQQWVEPHTCANAGELQRRLNRMDRIQREKYPSIDGHSRLEQFPELAHSGRAYDRAWEQRHWDLHRVFEYVADYAVPRQVSQKGTVSLYDRAHWVGVRWSGQTIYVTIDATTRAWVYQDAHGVVIRRQPAQEFTRAKLLAIQR